MDISPFISQLLYDYDCVIIPGFGGFIGRYQPAQINDELNIISPPSKAISFNALLQSNDGILVHYIASAQNISFTEAGDFIDNWVSTAKVLLQQDGYIEMRDIGRISWQNDRGLDFIPANTVNYLKSSYGLKTVSAIPVERKQAEEQVETTITEESVQRKIAPKSTWRIAAMIFLIAAISGLVELMYSGYDIKALNLSEAGVSAFLSHIFHASEPEMQPLKVEVPNENVIPSTENSVTENKADSAPTLVVVQPKMVATTVQTSASIDDKPQPGIYYIIVGVFREDNNVDAAKERLTQQFPGHQLLVERRNGLTRIGYAIGTNLHEAQASLATARNENPDFWLLRK